MSLKRTDKGRSALLHGDARIGVTERRILILSDGRRPREQLLAMLGEHVDDTVLRLLHEGYVCETSPVRKPALSIVVTNPLLAQAKVPAPPASPPATRRSLVVAKVYLLDILELQRDADSAALRAAIRSTAGDEELVRLLLRALDHVHAVTTASFAQRVRERLAEVLPEPDLPLLLSPRGRGTSPTLIAVA